MAISGWDALLAFISSIAAVKPDASDGRLLRSEDIRELHRMQSELDAEREKVRIYVLSNRRFIL